SVVRYRRRGGTVATTIVLGLRDRPEEVEVLDNAWFVAVDIVAPGDLVGGLEHQDVRSVVSYDLLQFRVHRLAFDGIDLLHRRGRLGIDGGVEIMAAPGQWMRRVVAVVVVEGERR